MSGKSAHSLLIAIEGCVGCGKTTIARGLAGMRGSRLVLEDFAAVPFLEQFYADPQNCALETEFAFLLQHYHQLHQAAYLGGELVADFTLRKDLISAELNMPDSSERRVFADLYELLARRLPSVAATVFIRASDDLILKRIRGRNRPFELDVDPSYYRRLNAAYETFFCEYPGPLVRIAGDELDFCLEPELFHWLSAEVSETLGRECLRW